MRYTRYSQVCCFRIFRGRLTANPSWGWLEHFKFNKSLEQCNALLLGIPKTQLDRLQHIQNMAARIVTRAKRHDHIRPILASLHWLPIPFRIRYKVLLLTFKALNGLAPLYLTDLLHDYQPTRQLRSGMQHLLKVPSTRYSTVGDRAFSNGAPKLWNNLSLDIRSCRTVETFKTRLKAFMFKQAYV